MIKWCLKHWKWGLPLLIIPLAILLRGLGWFGGLFRPTPPGSNNPRTIHNSEQERERIIDHRESQDEKIVTEADRERRDIDDWIDEGLNK